MNGEEMRKEERSRKREKGEVSVSLSWRRAEGWRIISCSKSKIMSHYHVSHCVSLRQTCFDCYHNN